MRIIPVLDLLNGQVVHARKGMREAYRRMCSPLCPQSSPERVVEAYLSIFPFETLYVADLNAIAERGDNRDILDRLLARFPGLEIWLDAGRPAPAQRGDRVRAVVGTETGPVPALSGTGKPHGSRFVLSLDFFHSGLRGAEQVLQRPSCWPDDIIVLDLSRVGSRAGPALDLLQRVLAIAGGRNVYLGGGIRNSADLEAAHTAGAKGGLVATALHDLAIRECDLAAYNQKKTPA